MSKSVACALAMLVGACASSAGVPLLERSRVEVPTAVAGVLETDGYCYRLNQGGRLRTIVWVEGTRFGQDSTGRYVTDIDGNRRYAGQQIGLSGGPLSRQLLAGNARFAEYLRDCGGELVLGLRFTGA